MWDKIAVITTKCGKSDKLWQNPLSRWLREYTAKNKTQISRFLRSLKFKGELEVKLKIEKTEKFVLEATASFYLLNYEISKL